MPDYGVGSYVLLPRLPLTLAGPFDLHVLGMPPAFILSQDQTLQKMDSRQAQKCLSTQFDMAR